ncbi:MAG: lytic transglycosylase domain-containing protein [Syntrophales bacterium]|nr:lytic transglycosylase domain-containing protein [Syntrophales bacterium]
MKERSLPDDLKYVLVVESSFKTYAISSAKAVGPWQFVLPTAKKYGLRVDAWIDERYNFEKATEAALNYLSDLYQMYGNWSLAIAAYNCGEHKVSDRVKLQQTTSFYDTDLPLETEAYIFRILAAKIILTHPEAYGYRVPVHKKYPVQTFDEVEINLSHKTPVVLIARAAGTTYKMVKEMNPEILKDELPPGTFKLRIPKGKGLQFHDKLSQELTSNKLRK